MNNNADRSNNKNRIYTRKTFTADLYKWAPIPGIDADKKRNGLHNLKSSGSSPPLLPPNVINPPPTIGTQYFCNAFAGTQGDDWITTYSYYAVTINLIDYRIAYVSCDYVS